MIGRTLSHYEILDEISRGGMGVVYRARDVNLGREVALKVLPDELTHDAGRRERLLQEARAASALEHPNIAVIHAVGEADGVTFIAMELIRGEKLSETLARGALGHKRALELAAEVAEGLARAHGKGIVHRDLKPANVMVTEDGHAKIIDFGLAKLVEPAEAESETATVHSPQTEPGMVMGTVSYMSPEQARGRHVDHRSDVFSFGVMLFEMLAGSVPFHGQSQIDTLHAILANPLPPLPALAGVPVEATGEVHRVITKCTAKDPDDRYQGMKDVVVDLRAVRRRLESSSIVATTAVPEVAPATGPASQAPRLRQPVVLGIAAAVLAGVALWIWNPWTSRASLSPDGKPSVAVLYFENQTGDASLDWMRTGLTDMMVTDLSQDANIEVLGTDRLYQILDDLQRADDRVISADVVQQIAHRAGVDRVLLGSYIRAGDTIRINARLQEAGTGRIVTSERVEGVGEAGLFGLVDELTRRIKSQMARMVGGPADLLARPGHETGSLDRGVAEVTTSSIEAYRYYAEGINLHERSLESQAVPMFEKAIEIDPNFAMALAKLAVVSGNLGLRDKRDEYTQRALDNTDRLTTRERYYIEGLHYTGRPDTFERGIEAYRQGVALHPEHQGMRHNLALAYSNLERYAEAAEQYEELVRRGGSYPLLYGNLARVHIRLGNVARAFEVTQGFVERTPDSAAAHANVSDALIAAGRLAEAQAEAERAMALDPQGNAARQDLITIAFLQERWSDAEALLSQMAESPNPARRRSSLLRSATLHLFHGRSGRALDLYDQAARLPGASAANRVADRMTLAWLLWNTGEVSSALATAEAAAAADRGDFVDVGALFTLAEAQARAGRRAEAEQTVARLEERFAAVPEGAFKARSLAGIRGTLALEAGDATNAIAAFLTTESLLTPRGPVAGGAGHISNRFGLASAYLAAGQPDDAATRLEWITGVADERAADPVLYVRSHYLLAQIYEARGETARAKQLYSRFLDFWGDGDMSRAWVEDARRKVGRD
jgi:tetratricopeptide (TPR) repeat protein/TolB-like protein/predicted Ser/Thr protein kinase